MSVQDLGRKQAEKEKKKSKKAKKVGSSRTRRPKKEIHTVSKGETLYSIAMGEGRGEDGDLKSIRSSAKSPREALDVVKKMAKASGIKDPSKIKPGDKVVIGEFRNGGVVDLGDFKGSF